MVDVTVEGFVSSAARYGGGSDGGDDTLTAWKFFEVADRRQVWDARKRLW